MADEHGQDQGDVPYDGDAPASDFVDTQLTCRDCQNAFTFTVGEQEFYQEKGFVGQPQRCRDCRQAKKSRYDESRGGAGGYSGGGGGYDNRGGYGGGGGGYDRPSYGGERPRGACYDFQEGRCTRGDSCRFSHDDAGAGGGGGYSRGGGGYEQRGGGFSGGARGACYAFQEGNCRYGDSCRFSHDGAAPSGGGGYGGDRGGGRGYGDSGGYDSRPKGACYAFQEGNCRYGDSCRFAHQ